MVVRYRVDGVLRTVTAVPFRLAVGVASRVKIMADLDIAEKRVPQDGRVGLNVGGRPIDLRVATLPTVYGEKIVMRILDKSNVLMTLKELGFAKDVLAKFEACYRRPYGAVLVTGPTGSGKSTTLYAALNQLNSTDKNIITIEDPVEYRLDGINQVQVNRKAGPDLRHRPALDPALRTPTSSWSARSATARPPRSPSSRRSPATWCWRRSTPTTPRAPSPASPRWASSPSCRRARSRASSPSGSRGGSAATASSRP